jgi:hypothetical protein
MTVAQLLELLDSADDVIVDLEARSDQGRRVRLGQLLAKIRDRQYEIDGKLLKVEHAGTKHRAATWKLVVCRRARCEW